MGVVFQRVLREGHGRRELGRVSQQGRRAPARRALGELVRVCRVLGSRGSQCVCGAAAGQALRVAWSWQTGPWASWLPSCFPEC